MSRPNRRARRHWLLVDRRKVVVHPLALVFFFFPLVVDISIACRALYRLQASQNRVVDRRGYLRFARLAIDRKLGQLPNPPSPVRSRTRARASRVCRCDCAPRDPAQCMCRVYAEAAGYVRDEIVMIRSFFPPRPTHIAVHVYRANVQSVERL